MGYQTDYLVFDISAKDLKGQLERHAALYSKHPTLSEKFSVEIYDGQHCASMRDSTFCPTGFLTPIGQQLASIWMEVRYQDGDTWDLTCYNGFEHELTHRVDPWVYDPEFRYNEKDIQRRIEKLCKLLPQFSDTIRPYLLLWEYPDPNNPNQLIKRRGKARETDDFEYGDALQILDFLACFGIDAEKPLYEMEFNL